MERCIQWRTLGIMIIAIALLGSCKKVKIRETNNYSNPISNDVRSNNVRDLVGTWKFVQRGNNEVQDGIVGNNDSSVINITFNEDGTYEAHYPKNNNASTWKQILGEDGETFSGEYALIKDSENNDEAERGILTINNPQLKASVSIKWLSQVLSGDYTTIYPLISLLNLDQLFKTLEQVKADAGRDTMERALVQSVLAAIAENADKLNSIGIGGLQQLKEAHREREDTLAFKRMVQILTQDDKIKNTLAEKMENESEMYLVSKATDDELILMSIINKNVTFDTTKNRRAGVKLTFKKQ